MENLERVYHSCAVPPIEKILLRTQFNKVESYLREAHDGINIAVASLQGVKSLTVTDLQNITIYNEKMDYMLNAIQDAIDVLLDMDRALVGFVKNTYFSRATRSTRKKNTITRKIGFLSMFLCNFST